MICRPLINASMLLYLTLAACPAISQVKAHSFDVSAFNNTNIGLARTDHMNDYGVQVRIGAQGYYERSTGNGIALSADFSATKYDVYTNLNRTETSFQIGYIHKSGIGFDKPRLSASMQVQYRDSKSSIRSGWGLSPNIQYSQNLSNRLSIRARLSHYRFDAEDPIAVAAGSPGWLAGEENPQSIENTQFYFGGEWAWTPNTYIAADTTLVSGEFSSMALPTSGLSNYASAVSQDDVCGSDYYNYRYDGKGIIASAAITRVVSDSTEARFAFQRSYVDADRGKGYGQNLINLSFSKRF